MTPAKRRRTQDRATPLTSFDHVDLLVGDHRRFRRYLLERLGMDLIGEGVDHSYLLFGDQVLGLHSGGNPRRVRVHHIAFRALNASGVKRLAARSGEALVGREDGSLSTYLTAPGGVSIELIHRPELHRHAPHQGGKVPPGSPRRGRSRKRAS